MKTEKHPLDSTMGSLASVISVKQWRQEPTLMGQGQRGKVNADISRSLAEK